MDANPWFCTMTTMILIRSATAVTSSEWSMRYEPSPTITMTSRSGAARRTPSPPAIS